tara:strand:- start:88 stop:249 length:162 start_codon:yes stop_codon:yes gene_type:complete
VVTVGSAVVDLDNIKPLVVAVGMALVGVATTTRQATLPLPRRGSCLMVQQVLP